MPKILYDHRRFMPVLSMLALDADDAALLSRAFMPDGRRRESNASIAQSLLTTEPGAAQRVRKACRHAWAAFLAASVAAAPVPVPVPEPPPSVTQTVAPANQRRYWSRRSGDEFDTLDLVFAAALMARGAEYLGLREPDYLTGHQPSFRLRVSDETLSECRSQRERGELWVPDAGTFWDRIRVVKDAKYQWHQEREERSRSGK